MNEHPVIVAARRSPIGTAGGVLRHLTVDRLAAPVLRAVATDVGLDEISDVVLGNVMGPGGNPARVAALAAGFGETVPGLTVDRQCASGLEAINLAASFVRAGRGHTYLAGGVESASTAPRRSIGEPPRFYTRAPFAPPEIGDPDMGEAADRLAAKAGISRERQDTYAVSSHDRAINAQRAGRFSDEIVSISGVTMDERPRAGLTMSRMARFPAAFVEGGTVTAANSCGVNDGAAAVAVVSETWRRERGLSGLRILDWETAGADPNLPGFAPVPAVEALLARNGMTASDVSIVEFNEAFAGQVLACLDALGILPERVCPGGGAIALGHPWGASGAVLMVRLFWQLERVGEVGLAMIASGGGLGVATLVQRVDGELT